MVAIGYWAYRYLAQRVPGALRAYLLVLIVNVALAVPIAYLVLLELTNACEAALLGLCVASLLAQYGLAVVAPSVDAYGTALASVVRGFVFSGIIVFLWYMGGLNLESVAATCIVASIAYAIILIFRLKEFTRGFCRRCLGEWIRGSWVPVLNWFFGFIGSLDVPVVLALAGKKYVAVFFALTLLPRLSTDLVSWGFEKIHAYLLRTRDYINVVRTARLILSLHAFIIAYVAANPFQTSAFAGKQYITFATFMPILAIPFFFHPLNTLLFSVLSGVDESRAIRPGRLIRKLPLVTLVLNGVYIALLIVLLVVGIHPLIAWPTARALSFCVGVNMYFLFLPKLARRELGLGVIVPTTGYTLLAYTLSLLLSTDVFSTRFLDNLILAIKSAMTPLILYYMILTLIDPSVRTVTSKIVTLAAHVLNLRASREATT